MTKEPEHIEDETQSESPQHTRGGWLLIGGFILALVLLVGVEFMRRT